MAEYSDQFEYDTQAAIETAWAIIENTVGTGTGVTVLDGSAPLYFAANETTNAARAVCSDTVPTTNEQHARIYFASNEEGSGIYGEVGVFADRVPETFATDQLGVYARLTYEADGVRTLSIRERWVGLSDNEIATVTLVTSGGIEATGYEGVLGSTKGATDGTDHEIRIIATRDERGVRCRAYVNQKDDSRPTLEGWSRHDFITSEIGEADYGAWWFGFGTGTAAIQQAVTFFAGEDYDVSAELVEQEVREDQVTLSQLREMVRDRTETQNNRTFTDQKIDRALRAEVEHTLNALGSKAWFMRRSENVDVSPDSLAFATMPVKMRHVLEVLHADTGAREHVRLDRLTTGGASVLFFPSGLAKTYRVTYLLRHTQMSADNDPCPFPREHTELLVVGACRRLVQNERSLNGQLEGFLAEYRELRSNLTYDMKRYSEATRAAWTAKRPRNRLYLS